METAERTYEFTNNWFDVTARKLWEELIIPRWQPKKYLEIGSYEGASAVFMIEHGATEVRCIDNWQGSEEHKNDDMRAVHDRFNCNIKQAVSGKSGIVVRQHIGNSVDELASFYECGPFGSFVNHFDMIYIDGSHDTADVITDACMAFPLLREGGILVFDDMNWTNGRYEGTPANAISAFYAMFKHKCFKHVISSQAVFVKAAWPIRE